MKKFNNGTAIDLQNAIYAEGGTVDLSAAKKYIEKGCALILEKSKIENKALAVRIPGNSVQKELIKKMNDISEKIKKLVDLNKSNLDFNQFVEAKFGYKNWYKSNVPIKMKEEIGSHRFNNTQYYILEKDHSILYPNDPVVRACGRYDYGGPLDLQNAIYADGGELGSSSERQQYILDAFNSSVGRIVHDRKMGPDQKKEEYVEVKRTAKEIVESTGSEKKEYMELEDGLYYSAMVDFYNGIKDITPDEILKSKKFEDGGKPLGSTGEFKTGGSVSYADQAYCFEIDGNRYYVVADSKEDAESVAKEEMPDKEVKFVYTKRFFNGGYKSGLYTPKELAGELYADGGKPLGSTGKFAKGGVVNEKQIREKVNEFLLPLKMSAKVEDLGSTIHIEPDTRKVGSLPKGSLDGMQISYEKSTGMYEVSEYMAGDKENELHIYKETKYLTSALKDLMKGNKRKAIKKYADGGEINDDLVEFVIPTWALGSIVNGDDTGLTDEEELKLNSFLRELSEEYGNANLMSTEEEPYFAHGNDIYRNMGGDVIKMVLRPSKEYAEGGKPLGSTGVFKYGGTSSYNRSNELFHAYRTNHLDYNNDKGWHNTGVYGDANSSAAAYYTNADADELAAHANENGITESELENHPAYLYYKKNRKFAAGGKAGSDSGTPKIYVADLAAYNEGELVGEWLDLSDYSTGEEVMVAITALLAKWSKEAGVTREEFAIHDTENIPESLYSENMGEKDFDKVYSFINIEQETSIPLDVLVQWASDKGEDNADNIADAYQGIFDEKSDFAYDLVAQGVMSPGDNIFISDTDRRIISGEEADNRYDEETDEDQLITDADMDEDFSSLEERRSMMEDIESELETAESELEELQSDVELAEIDLKKAKTKKSIADTKKRIDDKYDLVAKKEEEVKEIKVRLKGFDGFDFDEMKTALADRAKEELKDSYSDEVYRELKDPVKYFVDDQGIYTKEELLKKPFIQVDYDALANELEQDYDFIRHDGKYYVFSNNYAKGGKLKTGNAEKDYETLQVGSIVTVDTTELNKHFGGDTPSEKNKMLYLDLMNNANDTGKVLSFGTSLVKVRFSNGKTVTAPRKFFVRLSMRKGGVTFKKKVTAISKNLEEQPVKRKYQNEYGKKYNKKEAHAAATKIAGAIVRDEHK